MSGPRKGGASALTRRRLRSVSYNTFCALFAFLMLYPVLWLIASSFKESSSVFVQAGSLIPLPFRPGNYLQGWKGFGGYSFTLFFRNSFFISVVSTVGAVASSTLVAFGFARVRFPGRNILFACMMLTMMLPEQVLLIPQYVLFHRIGWINTFKPLIVPRWFGYPFFIFLIMQFIRSVPQELDESAVLDGCGRFRTFWHIILPLLRPALFTAAIFSFYWSWDDFIGPLLYLGKPKLYPVSLALKLFSDPASVTDWGAMFAMSTLSLLPVFLVFLFFQRFIVQGISTTGLKA
jgi:multiple sugar transport system permease protein